MFLVVCAALAAGSLAGCGGGAAGGQAPAAAAPVEVVIAPVEPAPAPTAVASVEAPKEEAAPDGDAVASATPEERAKMEKDLAQLDMVMLAALGGNGGGSVNMGVVGSGQPLPGGQLGGAAGLSLGGGAGLTGGVAGGVPGGGLGGLAGTAVGGVVGGVVGGGGTVKGPVAEIALESITGVDGVPRANATIAGMTAGFRRCYNMGLKQDPSMAGGVTLGAAINAKGEVSSASPLLVKGLSAAVVACMKARLESASFQPSPKGAPALRLKLRATAR